MESIPTLAARLVAMQRQACTAWRHPDAWHREYKRIQKAIAEGQAIIAARESQIRLAREAFALLLSDPRRDFSRAARHLAEVARRRLRTVARFYEGTELFSVVLGLGRKLMHNIRVSERQRLYWHRLALDAVLFG